LIRDIAICSITITAVIYEEYGEGTGRWNSDQRAWLRRREKNRKAKPGKYARRGGIERPSDAIGLPKLLRYSAGTLFHLIDAIPQVERDRYEIYPADFRTALISLRLQSNWDWRTLDRWLEQGIVLCGMSARTAAGIDTLGLHDYSEPTRLLTKFKRYEFAYRQKAASSAQYIPELAPFYQTYWPLLIHPPQTQRRLERIGRLYKNSCWWSKKDPRCLFDKASASSWKKAQLWKPEQLNIKFDPADSLKLEKQERAEAFRIARLGGSVQHPGAPAKRYARLKTDMDSYNASWPSYLNNVGLGRTLRLAGSLNIKHEMIEARNNMVRNLDNSFVVSDDTAEVA